MGGDLHAWMHKNHPQHVDAGNEQYIYAIRESEELSPIDLDELHGLKIKKDK